MKERRDKISNIFEQIKSHVDIRSAAIRYGLDARGRSNVLCPFHGDKHPSMHIYDNHGYDSRYICFSCGAEGDVIDFTAKLFGLSLRDAAEKLAEDFSLNPRCGQSFINSMDDERQKHNNAVIRAQRTIDHRLRQLSHWKRTYLPYSTDAVPHPKFVRALQEYDRLLYYSEILQNGTKDEQNELLTQTKEEFSQYEREYRQHGHDDRNTESAVVGRA